MKKLGVFALVSFLMLAALVAYSCSFLKEFEEANKKIQEDYVAAVEALRATNANGPKEAKVQPRLEAKRFAQWLEVRKPVAAIWTDGLKDQKLVPVLLQRRLRNNSMARLAEELDERSMTLRQYRADTKRWHALLALPEFRELKKEWKETVRTKSEPDGLPLPDAPKDATKAELDLIRKSRAELQKTLRADLLTVVLEMIESREGQAPEPTQPTDK
ncbi:MAG: hypothetical protein ACYTGZ_09150 [Planctomycetota bacterium]